MHINKILLIGIVSLVMISCKTKTVYVPVESVKKETVYLDRVKIDTLFISKDREVKDSIIYKDSLVYVVDDKGNILSRELYKWKERYRENNYLLNQLQIKYDSLLQTKETSTKVEIPIEVDKPVPYYPIPLLILAGIGLLFTGIKLYSLVRKLKLS